MRKVGCVYGQKGPHQISRRVEECDVAGSRIRVDKVVEIEEYAGISAREVDPGSKASLVRRYVQAPSNNNNPAAKQLARGDDELRSAEAKM